MDDLITILTKSTPLWVICILVILVYISQKIFENRMLYKKDEQIEKLKSDITKSQFMYQNSKNAFEEIMQKFFKCTDYLSLHYNYESNGYPIIPGKYVSELKCIISKNILYIDNDSNNVLSLATMILDRNSDYIIEAVGPGIYSFDYSDYIVFQDIYEWLSAYFRMVMSMSDGTKDINRLIAYNLYVNMKELQSHELFIENIKNKYLELDIDEIIKIMETNMDSVISDLSEIRKYIEASKEKWMEKINRNITKIDKLLKKGA